METNRLSKILAKAGVASRRACEELIFAGRVKVNGKIASLPQMQVTLDKDIILVDEQKIQLVEPKVYYMVNKPHGMVCSCKEEKKVRLVVDLFKTTVPYRLYTVGRLDRDTTGLILVTNDGHFANRVIHPSSNIEKEYLAKTEQEILPHHLESIQKGMWIEGSLIIPKKVRKVRKGTLCVTVMEGKKREVRLMLQNAGLSVLSLSRIRIGQLKLHHLPIGTHRPLSDREKELIFE